MASPAVVAPNGIPATTVHATDGAVQAGSNSGDKGPSPSPMGALPVKRKHDEDSTSADRPASANGVLSEPPALTKVDKDAVRDYLAVLQKYDTTPSILNRALIGSSAPGEHQTKRQKSEGDERKTTIAEKVANGAYETVESIVTDIKTSIQSQLAELRTASSTASSTSRDTEKAIVRTITFAQEVYSLFHRELSYPSMKPVPKILEDLSELSMMQSDAGGSTMLTVYGEAPRYRPLYSSLQQAAEAEGKGSEVLPLQDQGLPIGVKTTKTLPYSFPSPADKDRKPKSLGELFPPPRNLLSLQPPKAPKSSTKGVHVGWHRPELTEKSKYRIGSYCSQNIATGRWLDYSNAAPPSQIMTKQRERAMSLAGRRPSIMEIEASEMESLFRGAFSSFAPSKDDSAAVISSGLVSQTMWWQKHGKRSFDRLAGADMMDEDETADRDITAAQLDLDEDLIKNAIENWDDNLVDPSLEKACTPSVKSQEEKDADEILQDVSDLIQTLVSYQKNRNLSLPNAATQSRYAADPAHSDMLTNGSPVQPDEEERATYDALKAQLSLIVQTLPPYAVARLNSDKLDELNISMKIEIRTDEYRGSMDEDEVAARARMASQAAAQPTRPPSQRASSSYGQQYQGNRAPVANAQYYGAQTPVRSGPVQQAPQSMPPTYNQRPPGYRQPNQYTKRHNTQTPQGQPAVYGQAGAYGTPTQNRAQFPQQPQPGYPNMGTPNTQPRFSAYQPNAQTPSMAPHHNYPQQQQQQGTPSHAPQYNQYGNGAPAPRPVPSPHMQQQHMQPQQGYRPQQGTPQRQPSFSGGQQPNMVPHPQARGYPPQQAPMMAQQQHQPQQVGGGVRPAGSPGQFHPSAVTVPQGGPPRTASMSGSAAPVPDMGGAGTLASPSPNPQQQSLPSVNGAAAPAMTNGTPPSVVGKEV
ncbi:hypothetical protein Micbo1qcDRAFT_136079 [Microdochium bolleyi]|uniref:Uncharacterized protein n=1 Tax=Microdochium bolleyi TaxID=196109 RepID=A0A136J138_9PEZI|nr:hypothetical protein Micbo1qcDRAFT_136079 [Microdochium bolleyi]